MIKKQLMIN